MMKAASFRGETLQIRAQLVNHSRFSDGWTNLAGMESVIHLREIRRFYKMGQVVIKALNGIDLDIHRNEYVALMGPSGSGKSTLMNTLGCLDTPSSGRYLLNGQEVARLSGDELADIRNREIGFVFQTFNLLPRLSAEENVAMPLVYAGKSGKQRKQRAQEMLTAVGLGERMHHKPNELSGGQRQRVAIARALVNEPSIILADEPTGNLDSKTSDEIIKIFADIHAAGNTVIMVTHEEEVAQHAHRIIRLKDGVIDRDDRIK